MRLQLCSLFFLIKSEKREKVSLVAISLRYSVWAANELRSSLAGLRSSCKARFRIFFSLISAGLGNLKFLITFPLLHPTTANKEKEDEKKIDEVGEMRSHQHSSRTTK